MREADNALASHRNHSGIERENSVSLLVPEEIVMGRSKQASRSRYNKFFFVAFWREAEKEEPCKAEIPR